MKYTKAGMLDYIKNNLPSINVLPVMIVKSKDFQENEQRTIEAVMQFAGKDSLAVRSSSSEEDTIEYSNAGKFESFLNVPSDYKAIKKAIEKVYQSYCTKLDEEILIQPMLRNIKKSGVVFTSDINTFADYYTVNFYEGDDSSAVTSGSSIVLKTFVKYKYSEFPVKDPDMDKLIHECTKIENFFKK